MLILYLNVDIFEFSTNDLRHFTLGIDTDVL